MSIDFNNQVVIVTGAGQSLGRAYALDLARRGASVVVNDLAGLGTPEGSAAEAVVREIVSVGGKAVASHDSVATPEGGRAIVECALDNFGSVDAVIHNAGVWRHKMFDEMTADQLDPVLDVHLRGAFFVTQPAWSTMKAKGYGRIVLTSSNSGVFGRESGSNYAAAKTAMIGMARALTLEGERYGIMTNCIMPIAPFNRVRPVPASITEELESTGLRKDAGPELVAPMAIYLASNACAVSGEAFSAGGGRFGRIFVGVTDGWLATEGSSVSAEDIASHLQEIEDRTSYSIPASSWDELREIGQLSARRNAIREDGSSGR